MRKTEIENMEKNKSGGKKKAPQLKLAFWSRKELLLLSVYYTKERKK